MGGVGSKVDPALGVKHWRHWLGSSIDGVLGSSIAVDYGDKRPAILRLGLIGGLVAVEATAKAVTDHLIAHCSMLRELVYEDCKDNVKEDSPVRYPRTGAFRRAMSANHWVSLKPLMDKLEKELKGQILNSQKALSSSPESSEQQKKQGPSVDENGYPTIFRAVLGASRVEEDQKKRKWGAQEREPSRASCAETQEYDDDGFPVFATKNEAASSAGAKGRTQEPVEEKGEKEEGEDGDEEDKDMEPIMARTKARKRQAKEKKTGTAHILDF